MDMKRETPITKEYLEKYLDPKFKRIDDRFEHIESTFVTKEDLGTEIRSIRVAMHDTLVTTLDNMKEYYKEETERYLGVLMEKSNSDMVVMKENLSILNNIFYDHEERITVLEMV